MNFLLGFALTLWALGFLLARRLKVLQPAPASRPCPRLSVIIPARNEAHNLPALLHSLERQSVRPCEIIVVDDGSTDGTAELARKLGATVLPSQPLPEGWRGKPWACQQGAEASQGDWLMFVDADAWFESEGLERIVATHPGGAFSVGPYHAVRRPYENLSLFFNFNMALGTVPQGLFGQLLVLSRDHYLKVQGHRSVRGRVLENFTLAEQFAAAGIPVGSVLGRGVFSFRMYPNSLGELIEGWAKGFAAGAGKTPAGILRTIIAWITGLMLVPIGWLISGDSILWGPAYLACACQVFWLSRRIGSFHGLAALLYPVPLIFFFLLFAWSAARSGKQVSWKGREIRAD